MSDRFPPMRIEINDKLVFDDLVRNIETAIKRILSESNPDFKDVKDKIIEIAAKEYTNYEHQKYYIGLIIEDCLSKYLFSVLQSEDREYARNLEKKLENNYGGESRAKIAAYIDWRLEKLVKARFDEWFEKIKEIKNT